MALVRGASGGGAQSGALLSDGDHLAACKRDVHGKTSSCWAYLSTLHSFGCWAQRLHNTLPHPHKSTGCPSVCRGKLVPARSDLFLEFADPHLGWFINDVVQCKSCKTLFCSKTVTPRG